MALAVSRRLGQASAGLARRFSAASGSSGASLPDLPYDYNALEPVISSEIMMLHHKKHHQAYVNGYNAGMENFLDAQAKNDIAKMIELQKILKFNGGGHVNHSIFWTNLTPPKDYSDPEGDIARMIDGQWGSLDKMVSEFNAKAAGVQGSGWGWLGYDKSKDRLVIETTANQDPLATKGLVPLLGVDVWEHAYYLQYKNVRPDYLKEIWKVVNWRNVAERLAAAK